jgi:Flp pilus assembly protein TadG
MKIRNGERGQTTILFGVFLAVVFLGMAALALDVGMLYRQKRMVQAAADAAAIAASAQYSSASTAVTTSAPAAARQQAGGILASEVTPTLLDSSTSDVQVVITHPVQTFFLGALKSSWKTINVTALAEAKKPPVTNCLNTNNLTLNSGTSITEAAGSSCGINDNNTYNTNCLSLNSGVTIDVDSFHEHGTCVNKNCGSCTSYTPYPTTGTATVPDPYSGLTPPTSNGLTVQQSGNYSPSSPSTINLSPGVYNGINFNSGITTVNLAQGLYYMNGSVYINTGITLNGTGVTLYFANGSLTMNSAATVNLTAPTSALSNCASCAGMLIWQSSTDSSSMILDSGTSASWGGAIYVPDAQLTLNSGSNAAAFGTIYANSVMMNGSITLSNGSSGNGQLTLVK